MTIEACVSILHPKFILLFSVVELNSFQTSASDVLLHANFALLLLMRKMLAA